MKNSFLQLHAAHFKCSVATYGQWLPCETAQLQNISTFTEGSVGERGTTLAAQGGGGGLRGGGVRLPFVDVC